MLSLNTPISTHNARAYTYKCTAAVLKMLIIFLCGLVLVGAVANIALLATDNTTKKAPAANVSSYSTTTTALSPTTAKVLQALDSEGSG